MKRRITLLLYFIGFLLTGVIKTNAQEVVSYPLPGCYLKSGSFKLTVSGVDIPVSKTFGIYEYAHYSFKGKTTITVEVPAAIEKYNISPLVYGIQGGVSGKTLSFELEESRYLILKINNYPELIIAADDLETDVPASSGVGIYHIVSGYNADPNDRNLNLYIDRNTKAIQTAINDAYSAGGGIVYVPRGVYYCKNIVLKSNVHLYMEGGAVIRGTGKKSSYVEHYRKESINNYPGSWFLYTDTPVPLPEGTDRSKPVEQTRNIKIYGRGTIDGNGVAARNNGILMALLMPMNTENMTVDGIIFRDSGLWGVTVTRSNDVNFFNTKHFNENDLLYEDDAVDVQESQRVLFKHSIAVSEDDTYSTKTWENWTGDITKNWSGPAEELSNVVFDDCVAWSRCATYKIGFGVHQNQSDIVFKNSVSYRSMRAIAINHKYKPKTIKNVTFENIDIEGFWPRDKQKIRRWFELDMERDGGRIENILIKNINVRDLGTHVSVLKGLNANTIAQHITFENIYLPGESNPATSLDQMNIKDRNDFVKDIRIVADAPVKVLSVTGQDKVFAYPNPTKGMVFVRKESADLNVCVFDTLGRLRLRTQDSRLNISHFSNGIYIVQIGEQYVKLLKE